MNSHTTLKNGSILNNPQSRNNLRTMKKIIQFVIPLLLLLICNHSHGQNNLEDVVYLKNGEIVRGKIFQNVPNQSLRIQTKDRKVVVIKHDEIEKMTRENILADHSSNISKTSKF